MCAFSSFSSFMSILILAILTANKLSSADIATRGRMFIEWRILHPSLSKNFLALQQHLLSIGGDLVTAPQSCAVNNMHVTLNEWCVRTSKEVECATAVVEQWAHTHLSSCFERVTHVRLLGALGVFNARVVYVRVQDGGALARAFASCQSALAAAGITQVGKGGTHFTPHLTVCKATRKMKQAEPQRSAAFWSAVGKHTKPLG